MCHEEVFTLTARRHDLNGRSVNRAVYTHRNIKLIKFASFAMENLSDGAYLVSKEGTIVDVNEAAGRQLGYTKEEMQGMSILCVNPNITQEIWDQIWEVTAR